MPHAIIDALEGIQGLHYFSLSKAPSQDQVNNNNINRKAMKPLSRLAVLTLLLAPTCAQDADQLNTASMPMDPLPSAGAGPHDFQFNSSNSTGGPPHGRGGFGLIGVGGHLQLCPTGDCSQSIIDLTMHHLYEVTEAGNVMANRMANLSALSFNWAAPVTAPNAEGVNVTFSSFNTSLVVEGSTTPVLFRVQVGFYQGNGTAKNGEQIIDVPAGGLKFAVWIGAWPFANATNKLSLGLHIMSRNKSGAKKPKGERTPGQGRDKKVERLALQDAMFLDSPVLAQVDGAMVAINSSVVVLEDAVIVEYAFPKFKTLFYDPVVSSTEDLSTTSTTTETNNNNNLRSVAPASWSSSVLLVAVSSSVAALVAAL